MLIYYIMYSLFGIMTFVTIYSTGKNGIKETNNRKIEITSNWICFAYILILLMFRHPTMGSDLNNEYGYLPFFDYAVNTDFKTILENPYWFETGFKLYIKIVSSISKSHQFFIALTALLSLFPIAYLIHKKSRKPVLSWVIYISLMPFVLLFSGLRQGVVIGLGAFLYILAEEKKLIPSLLIILLAMTLHRSACLLIFIYPLVNIKVNVKQRIIGLFCLVLIILIRKPIFTFVTTYFPRYSYLFPEDGGGSYRYFVVLLGIYIICCVFYKESKLQNAYLNLFFAACAFQMLGFYSSVAPRAGFYFVISLCILLPDVIENMDSRKLSLLLEIGSSVFFVLLGLYNIYTTDWAMAHPYHWFWEAVSTSLS